MYEHLCSSLITVPAVRAHKYGRRFTLDIKVIIDIQIGGNVRQGYPELRHMGLASAV